MKEWKKVKIYADKMMLPIPKHVLMLKYGYKIPELKGCKIRAKKGKIYVDFFRSSEKHLKLLYYKGRYVIFISIGYFRKAGVEGKKYYRLLPTKKGIVLEFR